jgi:hypothetical protein
MKNPNEPGSVATPMSIPFIRSIATTQDTAASASVVTAAALAALVVTAAALAALVALVLAAERGVGGRTRDSLSRTTRGSAIVSSRNRAVPFLCSAFASLLRSASP